jgi:hypothetical protein
MDSKLLDGITNSFWVKAEECFKLSGLEKPRIYDMPNTWQPKMDNLFKTNGMETISNGSTWEEANKKINELLAKLKANGN